MALRRTALGRYGAFDPQLGRRGARLLGGEESDLFARLRRGGEQCWYVPGAVMYHIIPPSKLTRGYFDRLCRNIGVSQRTRAAIDGGLLRLWTGEAAKWCATLGIALGYCLTGRVPACGVARADAAADYGGVADPGRVGRRMRDLRVS